MDALRIRGGLAEPKTENRTEKTRTATEKNRTEKNRNRTLKTEPNRTYSVSVSVSVIKNRTGPKKPNQPNEHQNDIVLWFLHFQFFLLYLNKGLNFKSFIKYSQNFCLNSMENYIKCKPHKIYLFWKERRVPLIRMEPLSSFQISNVGCIENIPKTFP